MDIRYTNNARKNIAKIPEPMRSRIKNAISMLPEIGDIKKMIGYSGIYRLRVANYRVIYKCLDNEIIILILDVLPRGELRSKK